MRRALEVNRSIEDVYRCKMCIEEISNNIRFKLKINKHKRYEQRRNRIYSKSRELEANKSVEDVHREGINISIRFKLEINIGI